MRLEKIVSGGQTGADQAALDVACERGLQIGGWVPKGRLAEDGPIPERYSGLVETQSSDPAVRTSLNVRDSDATLIVSHGPITDGSLLTFEEGRRWGKPVLHLDLQETTLVTAVAKLRLWLDAVDPRILNVAGPRASKDAAIFAAVVALLRSALP
jgi:Circularly permutated YpsA SLOG family